LDIEVLSILLLLAASAGVVVTLLALGFFRRKEFAQAQAQAQAQVQAEQAAAVANRGRPGAGPSVGWFLPGGGRLGEIRFQRHAEVVNALVEDLSEARDIHMQVGIKKKALDRLRSLPWPAQEATFLARPQDPFFLLIDRPLEVFDPRYDRYLIVPMGFMEAAGGVEAFLGAFTFDVLANRRDPMDTGEALLRDAAEAAMAAGFAPPDVLRTMVQMLRQQVFAGRYRPYLAVPASIPGGQMMPPPGPPPQSIQPPGVGVPPGAHPAGGAPPIPSEMDGPPPVPPAAPPLTAPAPAKKPPRKRKK
jgi:hypothetical protein